MISIWTDLFKGPWTAQKVSTLLGLMLAFLTIYQFLIARKTV